MLETVAAVETTVPETEGWEATVVWERTMTRERAMAKETASMGDDTTRDGNTRGSIRGDDTTG